MPLAFLLSLVFSSNVMASAKVAVIYDAGGKFDKSFNESAYRGIEKFKTVTGFDYIDFEIKNDTQREQAIERMARKTDLVFVVGFKFITPLANMAPKFPDTKFVIIDAVVDQPNVKSVLFKEHEGSFLVGAIAAMKSKTGVVGFIGGMNISIIKKFELGYKEGAKYINPDIEVVSNFIGNTNAAWSDTAKSKELAISQYSRGADVIFHAAGPAGIGVLQAASEKNIFGIGVDSNQNYMYPGFVLTSMLKAVDRVVFETSKDFMNGQFQSGVFELGLEEGGVGYALDEYNKHLFTDDMNAKLKTIKTKILNGKINVPDFTKK